MKLPEINDFFLETPLYEKFKIGSEDGEQLFNLIFFTEKLDSYCPFCDKDSTFIGTNKAPSFGGFRIETYQQMMNPGGQDYEYFLDKIHHINLYCSRVEEHKMQQTVYLTNCLLYTSPSPRDGLLSRMPSSA